jgi:hypothetical protein
MTTPATVANENHVKLRYELPSNDDGWPPVTSEDVWAVRIAPDIVRIDSVPWFIEDLALDDIVRVRTGNDGTLRPKEKLQWSGNCTIRLAVTDRDYDDEDLRELGSALTALGAQCEAIQQFRMMAVSIPRGADLDSIRRLILREVGTGRLDYEEGCVSEAWHAGMPQ